MTPAYSGYVGRRAADVPAPRVHYDASLLGLADLAAVTSIPDQIGSHDLDLVSGGGARYQAAERNGLGVVELYAVSTEGRMATSTGLSRNVQPWSVAIVYSDSTSIGLRWTGWDGSSEDDDGVNYYHSASGGADDYITVNGTMNARGNTPGGGWRVVVATLAADDTGKLYRDGVLVDTDTTAVSPGAAAESILWNANPFNVCYFGELKEWDGELTEAQAAIVAGELMTKWGF